MFDAFLEDLDPSWSLVAAAAPISLFALFGLFIATRAVYRAFRNWRAMRLHKRVMPMAARRLQFKPWLCPLHNLAVVTLEQNPKINSVAIEKHKCRARQKCGPTLERSKLTRAAK